MHPSESVMRSILEGVDGLPFNLGKVGLVGFLRGDGSRFSSRSLGDLRRHPLYGSVACQKQELLRYVDYLIHRGLLSLDALAKQPKAKVVRITPRGINALHTDQWPNSSQSTIEGAPITEVDRRRFTQYADSLDGLDLMQKKAVTDTSRHILCVAGAGSGKTTALTRRIQHLVSHRSISASTILAITFTRKARMQLRLKLKQLGVERVHIHTFNSFCEQMLKQYGESVYDRPVRMMTSHERFSLFARGLSQLGSTLEQAIAVYYQGRQHDGTQRQLAASLCNDCYFVRDYMKSKGLTTRSCWDKMGPHIVPGARLILELSAYIDACMRKEGLRDYSDQLIDALVLIRKRPEIVKDITHVLVDEYQDINAQQEQLIESLEYSELFCVGDPRQAIYGWRGADIRHILDFSKRHPKSTTIVLDSNHRSRQSIVDVANQLISPMGLVPMVAQRSEKGSVSLLACDDEDDEYLRCVQLIERSEYNDIMIVARTNRQLMSLGRLLAAHHIQYEIRNETRDEGATIANQEGQDVTKQQSSSAGMIGDQRRNVVLATAHAIKGLEASEVLVIGCSSAYFPIRVADHPASEFLAVDEYDKYNEEMRLLYVAMTRACDHLVLLYSGRSPSPFLSGDIRRSLRNKPVVVTKSVLARLLDWRDGVADARRVAPSQILSDEVIERIALSRPDTYDQLGSIPGMTPVYLMRYGESILKVIMC